MIDSDGALGDHFFKITKTERIRYIPSHAQQHHIQRIVQPLQNFGNARRKGLSWCRGHLHRGPKQSLGDPSFAAVLLMRQMMVVMAKDHRYYMNLESIQRGYWRSTLVEQRGQAPGGARIT